MTKHRFMLAIIGPKLQNAMQFEVQTLPVKVKAPMPFHFFKAAFGFYCATINQDTAAHLFKQFACKEFRRGSYARIDDGTLINHNADHIIISLYYTVYNSFGVLLWPLKTQ